MSLRVERCTDLEELFKVWSPTYRDNEPVKIEPDKPRHDEAFAARLDDRIVGAFASLPMVVTRGDAELKCAGIAGVAVLPHERQHGVGKAMMEHGIRHYREAGYELASLYAFSEKFYRKFGYEVAGYKYGIKVDMGRFPRFDLTLPTAKLGAADRDQVKACYEVFARRRSGMNLRPDNQWDRIIQSDSNKAIYTVGDPIEAYAIVTHDWNFWVEQKVDEFVWTTKRGYESLLSVLSGIGINKTHLSWIEPSDSPYRARHWDRGAELNANSGHLMWRVLNAPKALSSLKTDRIGSFTFEVVDELLPENQGPWRVDFSPEGVRVSPSTEAGFRLDIRQFSQAFMGEPGLLVLAMNDLVIVRSRADLTAAADLLRPGPVCCLDAF
ncbi:MAG: GNAT family N-acetyltransferase [Armatimonadota bacterium]